MLPSALTPARRARLTTSAWFFLSRSSNVESSLSDLLLTLVLLGISGKVTSGILSSLFSSLLPSLFFPSLLLTSPIFSLFPTPSFGTFKSSGTAISSFAISEADTVGTSFLSFSISVDITIILLIPKYIATNRSNPYNTYFFLNRLSGSHLLSGFTSHLSASLRLLE